MDILENICPVCKTKNELEAVVCGNCGAPLEDPFMDPGAKTKTTDMHTVDLEKIKGWLIDEVVVPEGGIAVYIEGASTPIHIASKGEFVIGRKVGTTSEGLLDLSQAGGYHLGVSRRHAVIRWAEHGYEALDLGSANGTWLNEQRMVPHQAYPLASGSHLRLGNIRLFVLYGPPPED